MYQDLSKGGLQMVDVKLEIKSFELKRIKRLLFKDNWNWKVAPDHFCYLSRYLLQYKLVF